MMDLYDNTPEIQDCTLTFAGPLGIHNLVQRAAQATAPTTTSLSNTMSDL
jgi:hypothetical protein